MFTSNELLNELTTTELVILKDGVDVELARLDTLARLCVEQGVEFSSVIVKRNAVYELGWKMSSVIEARLAEEKLGTDNAVSTDRNHVEHQDFGNSIT
jgi:hypothetical protein